MTDESSTTERLVAPEEQGVDMNVDRTLRPTSLSQFIGQAHIKQPLDIAMQAAMQRSEPIEHVLLYGNPGLGKTTLANIIAKEMNAGFTVTAGPALHKVGDLAAILSNVSAGDILFIDEIHRINRQIEEVLYTAMEDFAIDIIVGKGPTAKTVRMPIEPFTLVGATTKLNLLSNPLRDRFGHIFHLRFYEDHDIGHILQRNANKLGVDMHEDAIHNIQTRARRTPRIANRLLRRIRDYAQVHADGIINIDVALAALDLLQVDHLGLDEIDRRILLSIAEKFNGGPVGLSTLAATVAEEEETIESIYEPYLLQLGLLERTPRGRKITPLAKQHLENL